MKISKLKQKRRGKKKKRKRKKEKKERNPKPLKVSKKSIPCCLIRHFFFRKSRNYKAQLCIQRKCFDTCSYSFSFFFSLVMVPSGRLEGG